MRPRMLLAAGAAAVAALGIAVPSALAQSMTQGDAAAFACYSKTQVDPGVWPTSVTDVFSTTSTYAPGYWAPYAETTVPTRTRVGSYYLTCNPPAGMMPTGAYVFGGGTPAPAAAPYLYDGMPIPGIYPVAGAGSGTTTAPRLGATAAAAATTTEAAANDALAFACYSGTQVDPGVWRTSVTDVFSTTSTYAPGYWAPYAETTVPTRTRVGSYYLMCNLPAGMRTTGAYVFGGGTPAPAAAPYLDDGMPIPGIYPVASVLSSAA